MKEMPSTNARAFLTVTSLWRPSPAAWLSGSSSMQRWSVLSGGSSSLNSVKRRRFGRCCTLESWSCTGSPSRSRDVHQMPRSGTAPAVNDGHRSHATVFGGVILPWIHSMVVVTSPMGLQAPPAFAAITALAPQFRRHSSSPGARRLRSFRARIVAVRLSITELSRKVRRQMMGIRRSFWPRMAFRITRVTIAKPSKWSIDSTRPMAGSRKRMTLPTSSRPRFSSWCRMLAPALDRFGW
mmetsp:Transcript_17174/g.55015  ORF Transcript_17174/g.55015 Transcript_17174/m.55015 type:complete len:239 (-) Transcript_17174:126-842(-)